MVGIRHLARYQEAYNVALELFRLMPDLEEPALLRIFDQFAALVRPLVEEVDPDWSHSGNLGRHMTFLRRYLERGQKSSCGSDPFDIVFFDMPALAAHIHTLAATPQHMDARLLAATSRLFDIDDYASVVRATFPVLSTRLRALFGVPDGSDGENLVNEVFARGGGANPVVLSQEEKTAYRNLLAGFYATYRNKLNHGDYQPTFAQARGVVEMANTLITDLELVAEASLTANAQATR